MNKLVVLISSIAANLREALSQYKRTATVEAEFGDEVVEGSVATLAHHGPRAGQQCPCLHGSGFHDVIGPVEAIGISHLDLDTLGGIMAVMGEKGKDLLEAKFWLAAAWIDVNGIHKVEISKWDPRVSAALDAWYSYQENNRCMAPRDGSVLDVSQQVAEAIVELKRILEGDAERLERGRKWKLQKEKLDADSLIGECGGVMLRSSPEFCNHLYRDAKAIVAYNEKFRSITISLADPIEGIDCCKIVQQIWGLEAGGHAGIAGSPRGKEMIMADAYAAFDMVRLLIALTD